jgi:hypothetical protein
MVVYSMHLLVSSYTEADIWLRKIRQQPRKIQKYDKANWDNIKSDLEDTLNKIININNDTKSTVNEMWNLFKNNLTESINKNITHKMLRSISTIVSSE